MSCTSSSSIRMLVEGPCVCHSVQPAGTANPLQQGLGGFFLKHGVVEQFNERATVEKFNDELATVVVQIPHCRYGSPAFLVRINNLASLIVRLTPKRWSRFGCNQERGRRCLRTAGFPNQSPFQTRPPLRGGAVRPD